MKNYYLLICIAFSTIVVGQTTIDLNESTIINLVKGNNLDVKIADLQTKQAEANLSKARSWWLPDVFLGTTFHNLDGSAMNSDGLIFTDVDRQYRSYGAGFNLDWDFAEGIYESKSSKLKAKAKTYDKKVITNSIVIKTLSAYYKGLQLLSKKEFFESLLVQKDDLISQLKTQVDAGLRLDSELLSLQSNRASLAMNVLELSNQYDQKMFELHDYLNLDNNTLIKINKDDLKVNENVVPYDIYDTSGHPALVSAELMTDAATIDNKAQLANIIVPKASLNYNYGPYGSDYNDTDITRGFTGQFGWEIPLGQIIYNGEGKAAKSKLEIQTARTIQLSNKIENRIVLLTKKLSELSQIIELSNSAAELAQKSMDQSMLRQNNGIGNIYEVTQAQEEFIKAATIQIDAIAGYNITHYMLIDAMGLEL